MRRPAHTPNQHNLGPTYLRTGLGNIAPGGVSRGLRRIMGPTANAASLQPQPPQDQLLLYRLDGLDDLTWTGVQDLRMGKATPDTVATAFDGATKAEATATDSEKCATGTGAFSWSWWLRKSDQALDNIVEFGDRTLPDGFNIVTRSTSGYIFRANNIGKNFQDDRINDGNYHHVVLTCSGSGGDLIWYVDGEVAETATAQAFDFSTTTHTLTIGENLNNSALDELGFHDRVLSLAEVQALYAYTNDFMPSQIDTLAWYDPNDSTTITESAGVVSQMDDKSGNDWHMVGKSGKEPLIFTRDIGGLNVLESIPPNYVESGNFTPESGNISMFAVGAIDTVDNARRGLFSLDDAASENDFQYEAGNGTEFRAEINYAGTDTAFTSARPGPSVYNAEFNFDNNEAITRVDGETGGTSTDYATKISSSASAKYRILTNRAENYTIDGVTGEFIAMESCDEVVRWRVEGYLAWKYGLQSKLALSHPYKFVPPKAGDTAQTNWTPAAITTQVWLDADDEDTITASASVVSQWDDKSGNNRNVGSLTGPTTGNSTINARNVLSFDGTNQLLKHIPQASFLNNTEYALFGVHKMTSDEGQDYFFGTFQSGTNQGLHIGYRSPNEWTIAQYFDDQNFSVTKTDEAEMTGSLFNNPTSTFIRNGTVIGTEAAPINPLNTDNGFQVGAGYNSNQPFDGEIAELVVVTGGISTEDRQKLEGYLAWKWGLVDELSGDHPYKNDSPRIDLLEAFGVSYDGDQITYLGDEIIYTG